MSPLKFGNSLFSLAADVTKSCKCHTYREKLRRKINRNDQGQLRYRFFSSLEWQKLGEKGRESEREIYKNERKEVKREREKICVKKRNELHLLWEMEVTLCFCCLRCIVSLHVKHWMYFIVRSCNAKKLYTGYRQSCFHPLVHKKAWNNLLVLVMFETMLWLLTISHCCFSI